MRIQYNKSEDCWDVIDKRGKIGVVWSYEAALEMELLISKADDLGECLPGVVETLEGKEQDLDTLAEETESLRDQLYDARQKICDLQDVIQRIFDEIDTLQNDYENEVISLREELE